MKLQKNRKIAKKFEKLQKKIEKSQKKVKILKIAKKAKRTEDLKNDFSKKFSRSKKRIAKK